MANAPRMFAARCCRVSKVWVAVGVTRRSSFSFNGILMAAPRRGQTSGLVEFAFALFHRMQRNGHDQIPVLTAQRGHRFAEKQAGEKIFKPQLALVFECTNCREMELHFSSARSAVVARGVRAGSDSPLQIPAPVVV